VTLIDRRAFLTGAGALAGLASPAIAQTPADIAPRGGVAIEIAVRPIASFRPREPERRRFGPLAFVGGLELTCRHPAFGGWSGLHVDAADRLVAVGDRGSWLTARLTRRDGRANGLAQAMLSPILGPDGTPLGRRLSRDAEGLAMADGEAFVTVERRHAILRFPFARDGVRAHGRLVPLPAEARRLPANSGLEAIAMMPDGQPEAGRLVALAERAGDGTTSPGFILNARGEGPASGRLDYVRRDGFDVTDMAFLPDGRALVLERRFGWLSGLAIRLRLVAKGVIRSGARLDPEPVLTADMGEEIDNMEGLAVHRRPDGTTRVTLLSDDNFSSWQRTLLLEFDWVG
jgi:hypothetical protein